MIFNFNKAQLGVVMEKALDDLMLEIQKTQVDEITVSTSAGGFPYKLVIGASGNTAYLIWDHVNQRFEIVADPLPLTKGVGEAKVDHGTVEVDLPGPAKGIPITVDTIVSMFMGLSSEQRTAFFVEVWRSIGEEKK